MYIIPQKMPTSLYGTAGLQAATGKTANSETIQVPNRPTIQATKPIQPPSGPRPAVLAANNDCSNMFRHTTRPEALCSWIFLRRRGVCHDGCLHAARQLESDAFLVRSLPVVIKRASWRTVMVSSCVNATVRPDAARGRAQRTLRRLYPLDAHRARVWLAVLCGPVCRGTPRESKTDALNFIEDKTTITTASR